MDAGPEILFSFSTESIDPILSDRPSTSAPYHSSLLPYPPASTPTMALNPLVKARPSPSDVFLTMFLVLVLLAAFTLATPRKLGASTASMIRLASVAGVATTVYWAVFYSESAQLGWT